MHVFIFALLRTGARVVMTLSLNTPPCRGNAGGAYASSRCKGRAGVGQPFKFDDARHSSLESAPIVIHFPRLLTQLLNHFRAVEPLCHLPWMTSCPCSSKE